MEKDDVTKATPTAFGRMASEIIHAFLKAKKNLRLYPANNPMYVKIVEETFRKVDAFLAESGSLTLFITRHQMLLGDEAVYESDEKDENLALFFFRDGLRAITMEAGLDMEELQQFLEVITSDFESEEAEEDLVTLLWEKDLAHIKYQVDETMLVDENDNYQERAEQEAKEDASTEGSIERAYHDVFDEEPISGIIPVPITEEDMKTLSDEMVRDRDDKTPKLVDMLFDMLYASETEAEIRDVAKILVNVIEYSVRQLNLAGAIDILRRTAAHMQETRHDSIRNSLRMVVATSGSPSIVKLVGEMLDSTDGINEQVFKEYIALLGAEAIPEFIKLLGELNSISGRKASVYALTVLGKLNMQALSEGLKDPRWFVVRNVVLVFRSIGDRKAMDYMVKTIAHEEPRVKKEVLKLFGEFGGGAAARAAGEHLYHEDMSVAIASAQALAKMGTEDAKAALMEKLMSKDFQEMELQDMKPFFECLAHFRDKDAYQFCVNAIEKNPMFGKAKLTSLKAGAIYCLGLIGSPSALPMLEALQGSKEKIIAEYAHMALQRIKNARKK